MGRAGRMRRADSLVQEAMRLITVAVGLVFVLLVAGVIEGFVTPSDLPYWLRIAIGVLALGAFWAYTIIVGSRAARAGRTGSLGSTTAVITSSLHDEGGRPASIWDSPGVLGPQTPPARLVWSHEPES